MTNEANLILSYIENEFYKSDTIEFKMKDHVLQMNSGGDWIPLHDDRIRVENITINGTKISSIHQSFETTAGHSLQIKITIASSSQRNQKLPLETTLTKRY